MTGMSRCSFAGSAHSSLLLRAPFRLHPTSWRKTFLIPLSRLWLHRLLSPRLLQRLHCRSRGRRRSQRQPRSMILWLPCWASMTPVSCAWYAGASGTRKQGTARLAGRTSQCARGMRKFRARRRLGRSSARPTRASSRWSSSSKRLASLVDEARCRVLLDPHASSSFACWNKAFVCVKLT